MPRRKSVRQAQAVMKSSAQFDPEVVAKRTRRRLEELERTNYGETAGTFSLVDDEGDTGGRFTKSRARQTISDKWIPEKGRKKKPSMNIRSAIIYKKAFSAMLDEADLQNYPATIATYLSAVSPAPREPPRMICSVCGYFGKYRCQRCGMVYCDKSCEGTHDEAGCERRQI